MLSLLFLPGFGASHAAADVIFERDSSYHHIIVRDDDGKRTLYFDNAPQSQMDLRDPTSGGFEYTDYFHCAFLFERDIKNVLFLGLGGGSGPKAFLRDYTDMRIDVVEVDPLVIDVAKRYFSVNPGPRLRIITDDARAYIKRTSQQYDYILVDAYTRNRYGSTVPPHLTTREFFAQLAERLRPGGVIAYNVTATVSGYNRSMLLALLKTMCTQFLSPYLFQAETSFNTVIVAFKGSPRSLSRTGLARRARDLAQKGIVKLPGFPERAMRTVPLPDLRGAILLTDDYAPVDRLFREG